MFVRPVANQILSLAIMSYLKTVFNLVLKNKIKTKVMTLANH